MIAAALAGVFVLGTVSDASARWRHGHDRGPGLIGGLFVGAATIATLPFAIVGAAARSASPGYAYDGPRGGAYAAPPPPEYGYGDYGPRGYAYGPPPPYGYGPPPGYGYGPRYGYGPPPGYYGYGR